MTITQQPFGQTAEGTPVALYTLTNAGGMRVTITNYGGKIVGLWAPDRDGNFVDIVLGFDTLEGYLAPNPFFGTIVGRYANRIRDARFVLNGETVHLTANDGGHHSHGGTRGFDKMVWDATPAETECRTNPHTTIRKPRRRRRISRHTDHHRHVYADRG